MRLCKSSWTVWRKPESSSQKELAFIKAFWLSHVFISMIQQVLSTFNRTRQLRLISAWQRMNMPERILSYTRLRVFIYNLFKIVLTVTSSGIAFSPIEKTQKTLIITTNGYQNFEWIFFDFFSCPINPIIVICILSWKKVHSSAEAWTFPACLDFYVSSILFVS